MQAYLEKIPIDKSSALYVKELNMSQFDAPRHFHPEYEIMMVLKSKGNRFVGDNISDYKEGDLVFLGPNLPHYWHRGSGSIYGEDHVHAIVIQFGEDVLGKELIGKLECASVKTLFDRSAYGIRFFEDTFIKVEDKIKKIHNTNGFFKIIYLFEILNIFSTANNYQLLSSPNYKPEQDKNDNDRIDKVYKYILDNYLDKVDLAEAASLANMNKSTFCHFFKKRTRKNFSAFVNEVRIGHASKLLIETTKNISEICYECGYKNLSNFNRRFKEINKMSPVDYRQHFNKENIIPMQNFSKVKP